MAGVNQADEANNNLPGMTDRLLGPDYDYSAQIRPPSGPGGLGMSSEGTMNVLEADVKGLMNYVKVLVTGEGASKTGKPLGTKFFLETPLKCTDSASNEEVTRSIYINNVPDGSIPMPIPSGGMSMQFPAFKGLLPGVMSNLAQINPLKILSSFSSGDNPYCQAITMETINSKNEKGEATAYVTNNDIIVMPNNWFTLEGHPKPNTSEKPKTESTQGFTTMTATTSLTPAKINCGKMPNDLLIRIYYSLLGLLGFYFFLRITLRKRLT